jgi:Flp pilus assembly protein TadG
MRWLNRAISPLEARLGNESGATIVFISVVLIGLMAMTAFVIDFGRIWQERRELQTGATAAVLAIGEDCALGLCDGAYSELSTADQYADANANDGAAAVRDVDLDLSGQTVHVTTATENTSGGDTMGMLFAGIIGFDTATIGAEAAAAWGTPVQAGVFPLILSECEWEDTTPGWPGGSPGALPVYSPGVTLSPAKLVTITFLDPQGNGDDCTAQPGHDADGDGRLPAGFGWIDTSGGCVSEVTEGGWIGVDPGSSPSNGCRNASEVKRLLFEGPILLAYYEDLELQGNTGTYEVAGHGAFVVAGYNFGGQFKAYRTPLGGLPCSGSTRCLTGWFVRNVFHGGGPGGFGGQDRGAIVIKLIG